MPSGLENLEGNRFILRYEHPWGGVASYASQEDIQPNQFVSCDGLFIKNGKLCSTNYYIFDPAYFKFGNGAATNSLYWTMPSNINMNMVAIYSVSGVLIGIDSNCNMYRYDPTNKVWGLDASAPAGFTYSCSQMIRGIIYVFDWNSGRQLVLDPATNSIAQGSEFVGGKYCMTLDEYLITCNNNMQLWTKGTQNDPTTGTGASPPSLTGREYFANRYNWSAAQEAYTTWNPNVWYYPGTTNIYPDPTTGLPMDRTAGWNGIADVQTEITGCFAMGNVGYILHDTGVTQITPTSSAVLGESAIQPFDSTLLWGGKDGLGCTMPKTLAVYGHLAIWGNTNGFYLFSGSSIPSDITGLAKAAIFADINKYKTNTNTNKWFTIHGQICNMGVDNNSPEMVYNLYLVNADPLAAQPIMMIIWSYTFSTQSWTRHTVNVTEAMENITGNLTYDGIISELDSAVNTSTLRFPDDYRENGQYFFNSPVYGGILINTQNTSFPMRVDCFWLFQYINDGITTIADTPPVTNLTFKAEEFQVYRQPTIRGIIIRAQGTGTLHISISGSDTQNQNASTFTDIILTNDIKTRLYRSYGVYTGMSPQINISSTDFNGFITKVHAFGTYAEGEPI